MVFIQKYAKKFINIELLMNNNDCNTILFPVIYGEEKYNASEFFILSYTISLYPIINLIDHIFLLIE